MEERGDLRNGELEAVVVLSEALFSALFSGLANRSL
jgi:hypothetical protein